MDLAVSLLVFVVFLTYWGSIIMLAIKGKRICIELDLKITGFHFKFVIK